MSRPRRPDRADLPQNLAIRNRARGEYFCYHSPVTKKTIALGYNRNEAIRYAIQANLEAGYIDKLREDHRKSIRHGRMDSKGLLDGHSILSKAIRYDQICGVYFLIYGQEIIYIGQSTNVLSRLAQHHTEATKAFDSFYLIECRPVDLNHTEALYIAKFTPVHNVAKPYVASHMTAWSGTLSDVLGL